MAKQSKRTRKFNSSGGVKARLQKGTITNKGKLKRKGNKRPKVDGEDAGRNQAKDDANSYSRELNQKREESDFVSKANLGDLDMDSFFETFEDGVDDDEDLEEQEIEEDKDDDSDGSEENSDGNSDSDDSDEDEAPQKKAADNAAKQAKKASDSESDSDSEDDIEEAERKMKAEMGKLKKKDPEFHEFLKENEESLLEYGNKSDDDEEEEEGDDTRDSKRKQSNDLEESEPSSKENATLVTTKLLQTMEKGTFRMHGVKTLRKLTNAFKSACHLADAEEEQEKGRGKLYQFESPDVYDRIMVISLTRLHEEFHYHLLGKGSKSKENPKIKKGSKDAGETDDNETEEMTVDPNEPINPKLLEKSARWDDLKPILFTFLKATIHILSEAKEPDLVVFVLKSLSDYVPYMTPFPRLAESMLKTLTVLWSAPIDSSEDYQVVRLHAFLRVRQLAMTQPFPFIEECLKKLYLAYAQRAKFATASSVTSALPTLTFMGNCVVELYSLDYHSSYQHAFMYIRQLALHLRAAMQKKTTEAMGAVYCWQYLHCLKLWVAVLTEACQSNSGSGAGGEEQLLQSLLFPLSQVILGTVRLMPSARYLPLRLHCVRLLQQLAAAAEVFLPTTSILLDVFDLKELSQPPKKVNKSNVQPLALTLRLRADNPLRTMEEMEMCVSEVFVLLNREVDLYQYSAGFPEFSVRICQRLRKVSSKEWDGAMALHHQRHYFSLLL